MKLLYDKLTCINTNFNDILVPIIVKNIYNIIIIIIHLMQKTKTMIKPPLYSE